MASLPLESPNNGVEGPVVQPQAVLQGKRASAAGHERRAGTAHHTKRRQTTSDEDEGILGEEWEGGLGGLGAPMLALEPLGARTYVAHFGTRQLAHISMQHR